MTTFEDFFAKKKIDISLLRNEEHSLYEEFRVHYAQMGEKSFDHTKKFWFNKLRKKYLLVDIEVEKQAATTISAKETVQPASPSTEPSKKPAGFKPRFKTTVAPSTNVEEQTANAPEIVPATQSATSEAPKAEKEDAPAAKPSGFKPRFKAAVTNPATTEQTPQGEAPTQQPKAETEPEQPQANKPAGFKPRFKAGVTKPATTEQAAQEEVPTQQPKAETEPEQPKANKPAGFKPRFKAGVTKPATTEQAAQEEPEQPQANKPAGFKPRFKAGVTKNKPTDENQSE